MSASDLEWAVKVERRAQAGERLPVHLMEIAEQALGRKIVRGGFAKRPDVADRAAGDRSFDDDSMVVL